MVMLVAGIMMSIGYGSIHEYTHQQKGRRAVQSLAFQVTIARSLAIMAATGPWQLPAIAGAVMVPVALFIVSRPSRPAGRAHPVS